MTFTQMLSSALATVIAFLPNLLAAALILVLGLIIAMVLARVTRRVLARVELHRRRTVRQAIDDEEMLSRLPGTLGRVVYWAVALLTIGLAIDALGLTWLSAGVARVVAYLPSVLAAAAILIGAYLLSNFIYRRASRSGQEAAAEHPAPRLWPDLLRAAIWVVAGFMALQELGIATTIVTSAFIIGLAAIAIAGAVAFGLGNRELAGRVMNDWYERRRIEREEARTMRHEPHRPTAHH